MRTAAFTAILLLAGCGAAPDDTPLWSECPHADIDIAGPVEELRGTSMLVNSTGRMKGPFVLHVRENSTLLVRTAGQCRAADPAEVVVGDLVEAVAKGPVLESYPPQTMPGLVFVDRL